MLNDLTIILLVLAAAWAGMFHVIKIIEIKNHKRDLVLKISTDGMHLTTEQRRLLLNNDYVSFWIGIMIFLLIYSGAFASLPSIVEHKQASALDPLDVLCCYATAAFGLFALVVEFMVGWSEVRTMRTSITCD